MQKRKKHFFGIDKRKKMCIILYCRSARGVSAENMRLWRNWQTRTFEGRVGNRMGSSPIGRTR